MLEEKDYYAALGVEQPGEKEQEAAEPVEAQPAEAVSDTPTGEQVQEPAEPAEIETQEVQTGSLEQEEETDDAPAEPDGSQEEKKHEMSQQQRLPECCSAQEARTGRGDGTGTPGGTGEI